MDPMSLSNLERKMECEKTNSEETQPHLCDAGMSDQNLDSDREQKHKDFKENSESEAVRK